PEPADAVLRVLAVEPRAVPAFALQLPEPLLAPLPQLVERPELDRVGRAGLCAGRLVAALQPVVAERALPDASVLLAPEEGRRRIRRRRQMPLVEHAERTGRHAVPAPVADVLLDDDRVELRPEERTGRADVQTRGMRAVL